MPLRGGAVVAIWNDILLQGRDEFREWHSTEHMPERLAIKGFRRGRRYFAHYGTPEFFTLYEADNAEVLSGEEYVARLNSPTPWTRRATRPFRNSMRSICEVRYSEGFRDGQFLLNIRFDIEQDNVNAINDLIVSALLPGILEIEGVCGGHLVNANQNVSNKTSAEYKAGNFVVPSWIVMIEADSVAAANAAHDSINSKRFGELGGITNINRGLYEIEATAFPRN